MMISARLVTGLLVSLFFSQLLPVSAIVGGSAVESWDLYPFFALFNKGCGGTLIHDDIVLTAAHCGNQEREVQIGSVTRNQGRTIPVAERVLHPLSVDGDHYDYDYQILKLSKSALVDDNGNPTGAAVIPLNENANSPADGDPVWVVGMGSVQWGGKANGFLKHAQVKKQPDEVCFDAYGSYYDPTRHFCARHDDGWNDFCPGDSGGPVTNEARTRLLGFAGFTIACGPVTSPGMSQRISHEAEWIQEQICALSAFPPNNCGGSGGSSPVSPPTEPPTRKPTPAPTNSPTKNPTNAPTKNPTNAPTAAPVSPPTNAPANPATNSPTKASTTAPTPSAVATNGTEADVCPVLLNHTYSEIYANDSTVQSDGGACECSNADSFEVKCGFFYCVECYEGICVDRRETFHYGGQNKTNVTNFVREFLFYDKKIYWSRWKFGLLRDHGNWTSVKVVKNDEECSVVAVSDNGRLESNMCTCEEVACEGSTHFAYDCDGRKFGYCNATKNNFDPDQWDANNPLFVLNTNYIPWSDCFDNETATFNETTTLNETTSTSDEAMTTSINRKTPTSDPSQEEEEKADPTEEATMAELESVSAAGQGPKFCLLSLGSSLAIWIIFIFN